MYKLLVALRQKLGITQAEFAALLGTDQAQISRLEAGTAGKSFNELCNHLRTYAIKHPDEWLQLLAASQASEAFAEYRNLFFITQDFGIPFRELWVLAAIPVECKRAAVRKQVAQQIRMDGQITYWVPENSFGDLRMLAHEFLHLEHLTAEHLTNQIEVITTPVTFTLLPIALIDPQEDKRIGVLSPHLNLGEGVRVVVLPQDTTESIYSFLKKIHSRLRYEGEYKEDEFLWTRRSLFSLLGKTIGDKSGASTNARTGERNK